MMAIIIVSIGAFTLASVPPKMEYVDSWVNLTTMQTMVGSLHADLKFYEGRSDVSLSDSPRLTSDPVAEGAEPFQTVETFCISAFTVVGCRVAAAGRGVCGEA